MQNLEGKEEKAQWNLCDLKVERKLLWGKGDPARDDVGAVEQGMVGQG